MNYPLFSILTMRCVRASYILLQLLRYQNNQMYDEHMDVGEDGSKSGKILAVRGGKRKATVLLYLSDVEEV